MYTGERLGQAIAEAIKEKKVSQKAVADHFGVRPPSVSGWIKTGRISKEHIDKLIEYFSDVVPPSHFGIESLVSRPVAAAPAFDNNVNLSHKYALHKIPIISWVQAGNWRQIELSPDLEYIEITTPVRDGYGLRVQGDSMMPEFVQGDIIVVSPHAQPENGSYVIVVQEGDEATFKKLVYDGAKPYFKPLNPQYPMLEANEQTSIVGVVKQKIKTY